MLTIVHINVINKSSGKEKSDFTRVWFYKLQTLQSRHSLQFFLSSNCCFLFSSVICRFTSLSSLAFPAVYMCNWTYIWIKRKEFSSL